MNFGNSGIALHPVPENQNCIEFGPDGFIAIAAETVVMIYKFTDGNFSLFRTLPHHKSNITTIRWAPPSCEIMRKESFHQYLAVGDESGTCVIYDVMNGSKHAGISPDRDASIAIKAVEWIHNTTLYVLTSFPSIICFEFTSRRSSAVETLSNIGLPFSSYNMKSILNIPLTQAFDFVLSDPFNTMHIMLISKHGKGMLLKHDTKGNEKQTTSTFSIQNIENILNVEYFPHAPNYLVIVQSHTIILYNHVTKDSNILINSEIAPLASMRGTFMCDTPNRYWAIFHDGTMLRFGLENGEWVKKNLTAVSGVQIAAAACDPYIHGRMATLATNGSLTLYQEKDDQITAIGHVPWFPETIKAWTCNSEKLVVATNAGYIGVFGYSGVPMRFEIKEKILPSIAFSDCGRKIVVGGQEKIHTIDLEKREISNRKVNFSPKKIRCADDIVGLNPLPNVINVMGNDIKRTFVFDNPIKSFKYDPDCKVRWAVLFTQGGGYMLDLMQKTKRKFTFRENDAFLTDIAFAGDDLLVVTSRGELYQLNSDTKQCKTMRISEHSLRSITTYQGRALILEETGKVILFDTQSHTVVSYSKISVIEAKFVNESVAALQTSDISIKLFSLPEFEPLGDTSFSAKKEIVKKFTNAKSTSEFMQVAREIGDLEMLQLMNTATREPNLMLPGTYAFFHDAYLAKERCTRACDRKDLKHLIEYSILTGDRTKAVELLFQQEESKSNLLLAHCCLSPSAEAARIIAKSVDKYAKVAAEMLILGGCIEEGVDLLVDHDDWASAIRFSKLLCSDEKCAEVLKKWIVAKPKVARPAIMFASIEDHHAVLSILLKNREISKGIVYLRFLRESGKEIAKSEFEEILSLTPLDQVIKNLDGLWKQAVPK